MKGHTKVSPNIFMISELITLGSFIATTIKKGARAGCRGAATDFVKYTIYLGIAEKTTELLTRKGIRRYYNGRKKV
jgi:hypothetical protein